MKRILVVFASLGLASSALAGFRDQLPPEAYIDPIDQQIARTGKGLPGRPVPCARVELDSGVEVIASVPTDQCVRMLPAQHWRGLWRNDFEGQQFCPAPATGCKYESPGDRIWIDVRSDAERRPGGLYEVEFTGRRTMYKGSYGHLGGSDHEIIVDRMISIREVEPQPPEPTKAQIVADMKACEANRTCIPNWEAINQMDEIEE